jgi:hypothetical protein
MNIMRESVLIGITIAILIFLVPTNVYAKQPQSGSSSNSSIAASALSFTTSGYAVKPGAFLSKCTFNSNAVPDLKNVTNIAFNQHDLELNHWSLKHSSSGPTSGAYVCILEIEPNRP